MNDDERAIRGVIASWIKASMEGDTNTILGLMTDDVLFLVPGQEPFGKSAFAAASQGMKGMTLEGRSDVRDVTVAGNLAFAHSYLEVSITPPAGTTVQRKGYALSVFRKCSDGNWRLTRDANLLTKSQ